jgi:hypothetical protein
MRWASLVHSLATYFFRFIQCTTWLAGPGVAVVPGQVQLPPGSARKQLLYSTIREVLGAAGKQRRLTSDRLIPCLDYEHKSMQKQEAKSGR